MTFEDDRMFVKAALSNKNFVEVSRFDIWFNFAVYPRAGAMPTFSWFDINDRYKSHSLTSFRDWDENLVAYSSYYKLTIISLKHSNVVGKLNDTLQIS